MSFLTARTLTVEMSPGDMESLHCVGPALRAIATLLYWGPPCQPCWCRWRKGTVRHCSAKIPRLMVLPMTPSPERPHLFHSPQRDPGGLFPPPSDDVLKWERGSGRDCP